MFNQTACGPKKLELWNQTSVQEKDIPEEVIESLEDSQDYDMVEEIHEWQSSYTFNSEVNSGIFLGLQGCI